MVVKDGTVLYINLCGVALQRVEIRRSHSGRRYVYTPSHPHQTVVVRSANGGLTRAHVSYEKLKAYYEKEVKELLSDYVEYLYNRPGIRPTEATAFKGYWDLFETLLKE